LLLTLPGGWEGEDVAWALVVPPSKASLRVLGHVSAAPLQMRQHNLQHTGTQLRNGHGTSRQAFYGLPFFITKRTVIKDNYFCGTCRLPQHSAMMPGGRDNADWCMMP
jgi:hypothetical protein